MDEPEKVVSPKISPLQQQKLQETPRQEASPSEEPHETVEKVEDTGEKGITENALKGHYLSDPLFFQVANHLGLKPQEYNLYANKISVIVDWAVREAGSTNPSDILMAVKFLERRLPSVGLAERRYAQMYKYVQLMAKKDDIDKKLTTLEV